MLLTGENNRRTACLSRLRSHTSPHMRQEMSGNRSLQSLVKYPQLTANKLTPRKKRTVSLRNMQWQESISDKLQAEKRKAMKPLRDIEVIMKKFGQILEGEQKAKPLSESQKRMEKKIQSDQSRKISNVLAMPILKKIKEKAQDLRTKTTLDGNEATLTIFTQAQRLKILGKYSEYVINATNMANKKYFE